MEVVIMTCKIRLVRPNSMDLCPSGTYTLVVDGTAPFERYITTLWVMGVAPDRLLDANRERLTECLYPYADATSVLRRCWPTILQMGCLCVPADCLTAEI